MDFPVIVVNFKTYEEATGKKALELAKKISGKKTIVCVQDADIRLVSGGVSIPVYAQHIDDITPGSHTGWVLPECVKDAGAKGTLLNHAEHKISNEEIEKRIERARSLGLEVIVCAESPQRVKEIANLPLKPDAIAVEPPELIGGDVSVSKAKPEVITKSLKQAGKVPLLCGAGVKTGEDVRRSLELGAKGVLLASGIVKATEPAKVMKELRGAL